MTHLTRFRAALISVMCLLFCVSIFFYIQEPARSNHEYPRDGFLVVVKSDGFSNGVEQFIGVYEYEDFLFELPATAEQYQQSLKSAVPVPAKIMLSDVDLGAPYPYSVIIGLVAMALLSLAWAAFGTVAICWNMIIKLLPKKS